MTKRMRRRNPFSDAFNGIIASYRSERNLRIHVVLAAVAVGLGAWLRLNSAEWCWIALCIALVITVELINTAIEAWVDAVSPNEHPLAKKAKDAAAGAVLVAAAFAAAIGGIIYVPKLWMLVVG